MWCVRGWKVDRSEFRQWQFRVSQMEYLEGICERSLDMSCGAPVSRLVSGTPLFPSPLYSTLVCELIHSNDSTHWSVKAIPRAYYEHGGGLD